MYTYCAVITVHYVGQVNCYWYCQHSHSWFRVPRDSWFFFSLQRLWESRSYLPDQALCWSGQVWKDEWSSTTQQLNRCITSRCRSEGIPNLVLCWRNTNLLLFASCGRKFPEVFWVGGGDALNVVDTSIIATVFGIVDEHTFRWYNCCGGQSPGTLKTEETSAPNSWRDWPPLHFDLTHRPSGSLTIVGRIDGRVFLQTETK
jgi:hypothetical protein